MKITKINLAIIIILVPFILSAQESIITFKTDLTGVTYDTVARNAVFLKPGFQYSAITDKSFRAHIDPDLPQPSITAVDYLNPSTIPTEIDQSLPVGAIPGQAGVSSTGAANYSIPIEVPPATQGMQPNLSVVYNSQLGNGIMGMGWNLSGLSAITRVPKTIYNDGEVEGIKLDRTDPYAFDGNRLIWVSGSAHSYDGAVYHTEVETYVQVTAKGTAGNGPQWFEVKTKDGLTMQFGNSIDSRIVGANNTVIAWKINRIEDQFSNFMVFKYRTDYDEQPISTISYAGNSNDTKDPYNTINFNYATRSDVNTTWPAGKEIVSELLLKNIEVINDGTFVKKYEFDYVFNLSSLLSTVTLVGSEGIELNVTRIKWDNGNNYTDAFYDSTEELSNFEPGRDTISYFPGDFDGDGLTDFFQATFEMYGENKVYKNWKLSFKNAESNGYTIKDQGSFTTGTNQIIVEDTDHDGIDNIYFNVFYNQLYGILSEYEVDATFKLTFKSSTTLGGENPYVKLADFDGNGVTDLLTADENNNLLEIIGVSTTYSTRPQIDSPDNIYLIDFNGNGKTDIMFVKGTGLDCCKIFEYDRESEAFSMLYQSNFPTVDDEMFFGEFNGDGKTDLLYYNNGWNIKFSDGTTFVDLGFTLPLQNEDPYASNYDDMYYVVDFNNDGLSDILEAFIVDTWYDGPDQFGLYWPRWLSKAIIHYNTGSGNFVSKDDDFFYNSRLFTNYESTYFADCDGNGMIDIITDYWGLINGLLFDDRPIIFFTKQNDLTHLATTITNGMDQQATFSYEKYKLKNFNTSDAWYKFIDQPVFLATGFTTENNGVPINQEFQFTNPYVHKQGKGFLGFSDIEIDDNISGFVQKSKYQMESSVFNQCIILMQTTSESTSSALFSTLYQPILTETLVLDSNSDTISKTSYITKVDITDPCLYLDYELFYVNPKTTIKKDYLQNLTTTTNYTFDSYGNPVSINVDYNGDASTHTTNTYTSFGTWWFPKSRLQQSIVTQTRGTDSFTATTDFTYNSNGALTGKTSFSGLQKAVTETYDIFDDFGNPQTVTVSAGGLESRETLIEYDDYGRFVEKRTNPLLFEENFTYDGKSGNLLTHTDINGLQTRYEYDGFGIADKIYFPDGNTTEISREWAISGSQLFYTKEVTGGQPEKWNYFDVLVRIQRVGHAGFNGDSIFVKNIYDIQGRLWKKSEPYIGTASLYTVYDYLTNGRIDNVTHPNGVIDNYIYTLGSTETKVSSSNGMWKTTQTDGSGALIMAKDAGGQIDYTYYAHGGIKNISYGGNNTSMTYDEYGRQTSLTDPDAGTISYIYNAFGELENQTDARANSYNMIYDKLGRLTLKKLGTTTVATYTYDTAPGKGKGQLASLEGNNNITYSYEYDDFGRLSKKTEDIQNQSFEIETGYNDYSQIDQMIYPGTGAYTVDNLYQNGYIRNVNGTYLTPDNIFTATAYNERGQITNYNLGNGLSTSRGYDGLGFPTAIQTPGIQNLAYEFNPSTGNLNWRKDINKNLEEDFTYDNLMKNRLESWQVVNSGTSYSSGYDDNGNVESKTGLGTYYYQGTQPHAVTGIDNTDDLVSEIEQKIAYTPFNKVDTITEGNYKLEITYGPDNARKMTKLYNNGVLQKTKYFVGGIFEKETDETTGVTTEINYINGGDGPAAIFTKNNTSSNLYYIHKDHLGSFQAITDNTGTLLEELNFDPWGNRRNPANWSYPTSQTGFLFDRGFTGHEHLDEFKLINMNGRVYDPILGRFLSPDNYVQLPDYTQSLNRYSYALNNPLIYTDPSGEIWGWIGAMFGNYVINGMNNWVNQGMPFGQAFSPQYNPVVFGGSYSPSGNTVFNNQVNAQAMPGVLASGQQGISNNLAGLQDWSSWEPFGLDDILNQQFVGASPLAGKVAPSRLNFCSSLPAELSFVSTGASIVGEGLLGVGNFHSFKLYQQGIRRGIKGNYQLQGRNFSLFKNQPMTSATRPISKFSGLGRGFYRSGVYVTGATIAYDSYLLSQDQISVGRYSYHTGTSSLALYVGYTAGGPASIAAGTAAFGLEYWYDNFLMWYLEELSNGLGRIEHQMKKGWYPGRGWYPSR